jgi:hypothetical protein
MLADLPISIQGGTLERGVLLPGTARYEILDFIADELPRWRDHPERKPETSETALTDQLCGHLNSAARKSLDWIQFGREVPDEVERGRAIDLAPKPCGVVIIIEGRRHTQFDPLFPIECKRLPTPKGKDRDEREYVFTATGTTGGIQRFKFGHHGAAHRVAAMIAYVQDGTSAHWLAKVNGWIAALATETGSAWGDSDVLQRLTEDTKVGLCTLVSRHHRGGKLGEIELRHLWIRMN